MVRVLTLEITTKGSKLWRWRYRFDGREQTHALGKYPIISLSEARQKRDDARKLVNEGIHPTREKKIQKLRNTADGENSFEAIARKWFIMRQEQLNSKYAKQTLARMEQHIFPKIGAFPITSITIPDIVTVIETIAEHGTVDTAHKMKQVMSQVFRYAAQRGMCEHNPAADMKGILPSTEEKHHACISIDELPELLQKIETRSKDMTYYAR